MSMILEALKKADQEAQQRNSDGKAGEGAQPWGKAWITVAGAATQQAEIPDVPADAKKQGDPSLFKPRITAAPRVLLLLVAGAIAANVWLWLRPPVPTDVNKQMHTAKPESVLDVVKSEAPPARDALQAPRWSGPVTLRGEIVHGLTIEMELVREGSKLSGSYAYERIGNAIPVRGTIEETGSIVLEEFVKGQKTGIFTGKVVSDARIEGKWSKPGSTRSRDFFLMCTGRFQRMPVSHDQGRTG